MYQDEKLPNGEECDRIVFHKFTHFKEGKGWSTPKAKSKYVSIIVMLYILTLTHDLHINLDVNFLKF